ncbi:MAG: LacI family DNA-binding transcriptional regulator [Lachnospiraceae bacterium]|nr:LacI family DNA-binding transcriptional regulator [Lachnospiraceae bacterium]
MATIKEIADLAGVSRGTVDRVLNKRGSVNPQTAEKILEIAQALDYKPNRAGLVLAAQKKNLKLGVILFGEGNPFFDDVIAGIRRKEEELACYNCSVIIKRVAVDTDEQIRAIDELLKEGANGIAISPTNDKRLATKIDEIYEAGIPVVTLNTDIKNSKRLAFVGSNYYQSGATAAGLMRLMAKNEAVHIGIIAGSSEILCHTERIAGFQHAIEKCEHIKIVETIMNFDDDFVSYDMTSQLLKKHPEINALFFAAGGVYGGCRSVLAQNRAKDMTIITFDQVDTTKEMIMKDVISATICQEPFVQGSRPLDILFTYLATGELPEQEYNYTAVDIRIKENLD